VRISKSREEAVMRHMQVGTVVMVVAVAFAGEALSVDLGMTGAVRGEGKKLERASVAPKTLPPVAPPDAATQGVPVRLISTVAGSASSFYGDGMSATVALFSYPYSLALDAKGNLYIGDWNNRRVRKVDAATGLISTVAGTGVAGYSIDGIPATSAELWETGSIVLDSSGNLYISDRGGYGATPGRVRKVDAATGLISTVAGGGTMYYEDGLAATSVFLNPPTGITLDNSGNLYVVCHGAIVSRIDAATGLLSTVAGLSATRGFNGDGIPATSAQLDDPYEIALDSSGNLYIADTFNHRVRKVTASTGLISTIAGTGVAGFNGDGIPATSAELYYPISIVLDSSGNLYISDAYNNRIRKVNAATGLISTVAGTGVRGYNGDGIPPTSAQLNRPRGIAMDSSGNLYIADYDNHRIRRVLP
jgi:sugar lactone lactonase YvrE